jgi:biotin-(acetyl-CoA carboxylase) ligase
MDEARRIIAGKFDNNDEATPTSFLVSATSQSDGRGTSKRIWQSSGRGNALFTIGVRQFSWMDGLKSKNDGRAVPLTLLPLKVGSLVATRIQVALRECVPRTNDDDGDNDGDGARMPMVSVKWPNDVLVRNSSSVPHEKIAGILVETTGEWFLIGIGIKVGYAPNVPSEGDDRGREATCLARFCRDYVDAHTNFIVGVVEKVDGGGYDMRDMIEPGGEEEEQRWIETSKKLAVDVAYDLHSWLYHSSVVDDDARQQHRRHSIGELILKDWKSYVDWDMVLTLRDTPDRERVTLESVLEDGRAVVKEVETGMTRTLVSDYLL